MAEHDVVLVAFKASHVSRAPGLVVHPAAENEYGAEHSWMVSHISGLSIARFHTRPAAENFMAGIASVVDWQNAPVDVDAAQLWAQRIYGGERTRLEAALALARKVDTAPAFLWEVGNG